MVLGVRVGVQVGVGVNVDVRVGVGVEVLVFVSVGVLVEVGVGVSVGMDVSTIQVNRAGVGSTLPALSRARTWKVWLPLPRPL